MNIRFGTVSDLAKIIQIENQVFKNSSWSRTHLIEELILGDDRGTLVVEDYEVIIGYLMARKFENQIDILNFAVEKTFQGKGIGWKLLTYFLEPLPMITQVTLEVNQNNKKAINLYSKAGFLKIGSRKRYYRDGSDALIMKYIKK